MASKYGEILSINMGSTLTVVVSSPKMALEVLQKKTSAHFSSRVVVKTMEIVTNGGRDIALAPDNKRWKTQRAVITQQMFTKSGLARSESVVYEETNQALLALNKLAGKKTPLRLAISAIPLNVMLRLSASVRLGASKRATELVSIIHSLVEVMAAANLADHIPWLAPLMPQSHNKVRVIEKRLRKVYYQMIAEHKATLTPGHPRDLIDACLDAGFDDVDTRQVAQDSVNSGTDTSALTVVWELLILANRPEIQRQVHAELDAVVGRDRLAVYEDMERLPFLKAVVFETMRYRSVAPLMVPHKNEKAATLGGYRIPAQTQVFVNVHALHYNSDVYPSPHTFDPRRFLDNSPNFLKPKGDFLPFGAGRRMCVGYKLGLREVFIISARMLQVFQFSTGLPEGQKLSETEKFGISVCPLTPVALIPTPRLDVAQLVVAADAHATVSML